MITNCTCSEQVLCNCTVSFDTYTANSVSVLSVGNLVGGTCTFSEYVIDWYRDGVHSMVSGIGNDPDIETFHPFTGSAAVPVVGGTWVPIIRYVVISGNKIYSSKKSCRKWCNSLNGLPSITVTNIGCGITGGGAPTGWDYRISYTSNQDYSLASRTIKYMLPNDLSAKYFVSNFFAYDVSDKYEVFFKDDTTPITSFIIGTRFNSYSYNTTPVKVALTSHKISFEIPTYQAGDYLTIKITPSVLETNTNTNWTLDIACLPSGYDFNCNFAKDTWRTLDLNTVRFIYNSTLCRFELRVKPSEWPESIITTNPFLLYQGYSYTTLGGKNIVDSINKEYGMYFTVRYRVTDYSYGGNPTIYSTTDGNITINKTGNLLTYTFASDTDYQSFKSKVQFLQTSDLFNLWNSSDTTDIRYYRFFDASSRITPVQCGDAFTPLSVIIHISSSVTINDISKSISFTLNNISNNLPDISCDTSKSTINQYIVLNNNLYNSPDFNYTTRCHLTDDIIGRAYNDKYLEAPTTVDAGYALTRFGSVGTICGTIPGYCYASYYSYLYGFYLFYLRGVITNTSDPENNFEIYTLVDPVTSCNIPATLIYKKENGIVVYP